MFENLSNKLTRSLRNLRGQGHITEKNIEQAVRDIRMSLLEADVNFKVVKSFVDSVRQQALGAEVLKNIDAGQHFTKIVHDELVNLLGGAGELKPNGESDAPPDAVSPVAKPASSYQALPQWGLNLRARPSFIFLVGLQGAGKTTTCGKLALYIQKKFKKRVGFVALDLRRPAAIEQLQQLGNQVKVPVLRLASTNAASTSAASSSQGWQVVADAHKQWVDDNMLEVVLVDTAGRTQIDTELMHELLQQKQFFNPQEVLFVADCMLGQEALNVAGEFHKQLGLTGLILSKADGDARGGVVLSVRAQLGLPCRFLGVGEKLTGLEEFHADRMASRILGMGDVLSLVEKAEAAIDKTEAEGVAQRMQSGQLTLDDFLSQMKMLKKMGGAQSVMKMMPGLGQMANKMPDKETMNKQMKRTEAIVYSMTRRERRDPSVLNGSRRRRIARGSGTQVQDVNKLLRGFAQSKKMIKMMQTQGLGGLMKGFMGR